MFNSLSPRVDRKERVWPQIWKRLRTLALEYIVAASCLLKSVQTKITIQAKNGNSYRKYKHDAFYYIAEIPSIDYLHFWLQ